MLDDTFDSREMSRPALDPEGRNRSCCQQRITGRDMRWAGRDPLEWSQLSAPTLKVMCTKCVLASILTRHDEGP